MRNWSIVTKIVVSTCGVVCVLLMLGSLLLFRFEIDMVESFDVEYREKMLASLDERKQELKASLEKNVTFNTKIFAGTVAIHLFNYDPVELQKSLIPFMSYPEIYAVKVLDEEGQVFSAAWKDPAIETGDALPASLALETALLVEVASMRDEEQLGTVQVYYQEAVLTEKINNVKERMFQQTQDFRALSRARLNRAIIMQSTGIFIILLILVGCLLGFLSVLVRKPLVLISGLAQKLANFDLTLITYPKTRDEIGRLLSSINTLIQSFRRVISQVQQAGINVRTSATQLSATAKEQETIVVQQVDSMEKVVNSVREISDVAEHLAQTMQQVSAMSQEAADFGKTGQDDLGRIKQATQQMEAASQRISGRLEAIHEKMENITTVVTTISKVADQTNLLSLNAAIEAEKAGEYGRGFTVVAREIRRLADQTAFATLDITQMVQEMQAAVSTGVTEMDRFIADVRNNSKDVGNVSLHLSRVIEYVQALSPNFENVNEAMGYQADHVQNINHAIHDLREDMQETKSSLQETYAVIGQLNDAIVNLQEEISRFKVS